MSIKNLSRRRFMFGLGAVSTGLLIGVQLEAAEKAAFPEKALLTALPEGHFQPDVFISVAPTGQVSIICHRSEMGQGVRSSLPLLIADEMEADWDRVTVEQAIADEVYGSQNTDGSRSVRRHYRRLRQAGATARTMFQQAAAKYWQVKPEECEVYNHQVTHLPSGQQVDFAKLVPIAIDLEIPKPNTLKFKDDNQLRYVGRDDIALVDGLDIVTGKSIFGFDVQRDGLLVAVIARPPVLFGKPKKWDVTAAKKVKGVVDVIEMPALTPPALFKPLGGIAVLATNTYAAIKGRDALNIEWEDGENASHSTEAHEKVFAKSLDKPAHIIRHRGDYWQAEKSAAQTLNAEYWVPGLIHAPMEPPAATALYTPKGELHAWACTQTPQSCQNNIAEFLQIDKSKIMVNVTMLGGGFGRKSKPDFVVEAAWLAKQTNKPVKVLWTREDEIKNGYYHSPSLQRLSASIDKSGSVTGLRHSMVNHPIGWTFNTAEKKAGGDSLGQADAPFAIPNILINNGETDTFYRIGWVRSVTNINNAFAAGSFVDELAHELKKDPLDMWLQLIGPDRNESFDKDSYQYWNYGDKLEDFPVDTKRLKSVLKKAAELAGWGKKLPQNKGMGISVHRSFCSYVANVVEVTEQNGRISMDKVISVVDCGKVINPERVRSQMEGAAIFGASLALYGEITAKDGRIEQGNFDDYAMLRMNDCPDIEVHIVESNERPAGVGEPGVPPFAAALCNAIFAATGKRYRRLPLAAHGIV